MVVAMLIEASLFAFCVGAVAFGPPVDLLEEEHRKFQAQAAAKGGLTNHMNRKIDKFYMSTVRLLKPITGFIGFMLFASLVIWLLLP